LWIVGPARRHPHVAGCLEECHPAVPARGKQPETMNEDNGPGAGGVRALDLCSLVISESRFGGRGVHVRLLVSCDSTTSVVRSCCLRPGSATRCDNVPPGLCLPPDHWQRTERVLPPPIERQRHEPSMKACVRPSGDDGRDERARKTEPS